MPVQTIKLLPGVNIEATAALGEMQIVSSNLIRWKQAGPDIIPEKLGGWKKFYPTPLGSPIRELHAWEGINADNHLAAGCTLSLNVITSGVGSDITPRTLTTNPAVSVSTTNGSNVVTIKDAGISTSIYDTLYLLTPIAVGGLILQGPYTVVTVVDSSDYTITAKGNANATVANGGAVPSFATTSGSPTITVTLASHGYSVGQVFNVPVSTAIGGITVSGAYVIQSVPSTNTFTINTATSASSTATGSMNGGNASIRYYIGIGPPSPFGGYGTSTYGSGGYGLGVVPPPSAGNPITATNWSLDNWGEVLLACPANGPIYSWAPDSGITNATRILNAPEINGGIFVSEPAQILVAWGSSQGGVQDPLTLNWSNAGDYTNWTVSSQTQAGGYRFPTGSRIVGGLAGPNFGVIWTDLGVWSMDYIEPPLVFGFNSLGTNCGLVSRHAACVLNSIVYWMSNDKFNLLIGETVQTIPCSVWDFVFQDLDLNNVDKIYAGTNSLFGEITFYFPSLSGGTGEIDSYVKHTPALGLWDCGRLARSAWTDQSPVGPPVGASPTGYLYQHEVSNDADGQPMNPWFETGYFTVAEGDNLNFVDWYFPDFKYGTYQGSKAAILQVTMRMTDYPNGAPVRSRGPYSVSASVPYVNTRLRGRYASIRIESNDLGSFWRLGKNSIRSVADGKR